MSKTFEEIQAIDASSIFVSATENQPTIILTPEQLLKLNELTGLVDQVGQVDFDTEVDALIEKMKVIRDSNG